MKLIAVVVLCVALSMLEIFIVFDAELMVMLTVLFIVDCAVVVSDGPVVVVCFVLLEGVD